MEFVDYRTNYLFLGTICSPEYGKRVIVLRVTDSFLSFLNEVSKQIKEIKLTSSITFSLYSIADVVTMEYSGIESLCDDVEPSFIKLSKEEEGKFSDYLVKGSMSYLEERTYYSVRKSIRFRNTENDSFVYVEGIDDVLGGEVESSYEVRVSEIFDLFNLDPLYRVYTLGDHFVEGVIRRGDRVSKSEVIVDFNGNHKEVFSRKKCRSTNVFDSNGDMIFEDDITDRGRVYLDQPGNFPYVVENVGGEEKRVYICGETSLKVIGNIYDRKD